MWSGLRLWVLSHPEYIGAPGVSLLFTVSSFNFFVLAVQIDGKRNPKVQSVFIQNFPIHKAAFVPDGSSVVATGRRKFFYVYDLESGKVETVNCLVGIDEKSLESFECSPDGKIVAFMGNEGYIILASLLTRQTICTLKMNGMLCPLFSLIYVWYSRLWTH